MGRKQKERQKKKKKNQKLLAAATATATAAATATASSGNAAGGNTSATAVRSRRSSSVVDVEIAGDGDGDVDVDVDDGVAAAKKGATMEATPIATCNHGSTAENITKGSNFQMAIDEWLTIVMNLAGKNPIEARKVLSAFYVKHKELTNNPEFNQGVFAVATDIFLKNSYGSEEYDSSSKEMLQDVLNLGIKSKYRFDREKCHKYIRDSLTNRGIINVLFRETNIFCNCMKPYKEDAKVMEKIGMCCGCADEFPKIQLRCCSRCLTVKYCSNKCMKNDWPTHKQFCTQHYEQTSEE